MMQYLYSIYNSASEQFGVVFSFPCDQVAINFFADFCLQNRSFMKISLYRVGVFNSDTGVFEGIEPVSLNDEVQYQIKTMVESNKRFRAIVRDFIESLPCELEEDSSDET